MEGNASISDLSLELLEFIFFHFANSSDDDTSLLRCEAVCTRWKDVLSSFGAVYKRKCLRELAKTPELKSVFGQHKFFNKENGRSALFYKDFYFRLRKVDGRWNTKGPSPKVTVLDCVGTSCNGKSIEVPEFWRKTYNYTGLYDMSFCRDTSYLTCSVFNNIQVWDMETYSCISQIGPEILDTAEARVTCFYTSGLLLACGNERGVIKLFDLITAREVGQYKHSGCFLSDVKIHGRSLMTLNVFGEITEWDLDQEKLKHVADLAPPFTNCDEDGFVGPYRRKHTERLLDFNDDLIMATRGSLLCVFSRDPKNSAEIYFSANVDVLCCKLYRNQALWGGHNGSVFWVRAEASTAKVIKSVSDPAIKMFVTQFQDNITSLDVIGDKLLLGDVNGEVHYCRLSRMGEEDCWQFTLDSGHEPQSYVWAVSGDPARIFSGDSQGKLVIHDFWDYSSSSGS